MNILHVTNSLNPSYGGPAACIPALSSALAALGHPSEIACLDAPDAPFLAAIDAPVHAFGPVGHGFGYSPGLLPWLKTQARAKRFDAVIVHGLWQYPGVAARLAFPPGGATRRLVFPHGMLDPWFKRAYPGKHFRKLLYWLFVERCNLVGADAVLFTCDEEKRLARSTFPASSYPARVVAFGIPAPPDRDEAQRAALYSAYPDLQYRPFWIFLGRLHPKKGVELLIDAYGALAKAGSFALPRLVIAGPCDDAEYLAGLKALATHICPADSVVWPGMLSGDMKWGALRAAEAFILPSHQENFGIAVVEALACRTPVLISDQVNIHREIAGDLAGLVEPDTAEGVRRLLRRWLDLQPDARRAMRATAERCFLSRFEMGAVARGLVATLA
ncbi:MAG: glycosyltransferase [Burkholderiales bacterium]|nr:glycosyltransferase [Opitutaceae bacterium]